MIWEYSKWGFGTCDCCMNGTWQEVRVAYNRHMRRKHRRELKHYKED